MTVQMPIEKNGDSFVEILGDNSFECSLTMDVNQTSKKLLRMQGH